MPKSPRKKNQVSIWFNAILRETVRGETVSEETVTVKEQIRSATRAYRVPECIKYQSVTVDNFSKESDFRRPGMKETGGEDGHIQRKEL